MKIIKIVLVIACVSGIAIAAQLSTSCYGVVMDNGAPAAGVYVTIYNNQSSAGTGVTDGGGHFAVGCSGSGNTFFCASKNGRWYHTFFVGGACHGYNIGTVSLRGGSHPGHPSW